MNRKSKNKDYREDYEGEAGSYSFSRTQEVGCVHKGLLVLLWRLNN